MAKKQNIVIDGGSTSSGSVPFLDAQSGDVAFGQVRLWAGSSNLMATLDCLVDVGGQRVTWQIDRFGGSQMHRHGYYDIKVARGSSLITVAYGQAVLRPGITIPDSLTWAQFIAMNWGSFNNLRWGDVA